MGYGNGGDFSTSYVPSTVDPGPWVLVGTPLICAVMLLMAFAFVSLKKRRKARKKAREEMQQRIMERQQTMEENDTSILGENVEVFFSNRAPRKGGSLFKGWNEVTNEIEANSARAARGRVGRATAASERLGGTFYEGESLADQLHISCGYNNEAFNVVEHATSTTKSTADVADVLSRDLFERGGMMDQIQVNFGCNGTMCVPDDASVSSSRPIRNALTSDESSSQASGLSDISSATDYNLIDSEHHRLLNPCRYIGSLISYDHETKKLLKRAIPYSVSNLVDGLFGLIRLAIIGRMIGIRDLSAYIVVHFVFKVSTLFLEGLVASVSPMCSRAIGAGQFDLAGQYLQISIFSTQGLFLPQIYLWWSSVDDLMLWFDYNNTTAWIAHSYARVFAYSGVIDLLRSTVLNFLDATGHANFSAIADASHGLTRCLATFGAALYFRGHSKALEWVGIVNVIVDVMGFVAQLGFVARKRWLHDYLPGMTGSFALWNYEAVRLFFKSAVPLSFFHMLSDSVRQVLFILAGVLGPAELAVWGITGEIWSVFESLTFAWGEAAEDRCRDLLTTGDFEKAQVTAHKSLLMGCTAAAATSALLFVGIPYVPGWFTTDDTLQSMLIEVLPLVALGNVVMIFSSTSWQLLGAQGRYSMSTAVHCLGSLVVTLPLAFLSSLRLNWNLTSLLATVVLGGMVSGTLNFVILCCTNWEKRSKKIMAKMAATAVKNDSLRDSESEATATSSEYDSEVDANSVEDIRERFKEFCARQERVEEENEVTFLEAHAVAPATNSKEAGNETVSQKSKKNFGTNSSNARGIGRKLVKKFSSWKR